MRADDQIAQEETPGARVTPASRPWSGLGAERTLGNVHPILRPARRKKDMPDAREMFQNVMKTIGTAAFGIPPHR